MLLDAPNPMTKTPASVAETLRQRPGLTEPIALLGAPVDSGGALPGCQLGPEALRVAGLSTALRQLGHTVEDRGDIGVRASGEARAPAWVEALTDAAFEASGEATPVFLGGDHLMSAGTVAGMARRANARGRPLFMLWLDAHSDFHTPATTESGHLHGTPVAYLTGQEGFDAFAPCTHPLPLDRVAMIGLRSVDRPERERIARTGLDVVDMRRIDENGIARPLQAFLDRVTREGGDLHVSLDVDFLDPSVAPAVGTAVPGGASLREAHLVMEILHESGLVTSLDIAELNPCLDERNRTARLMVDLAASLFGRRVLDLPAAR